MGTYWDGFITEKIKKNVNYFTEHSISSILESFYHWLHEDRPKEKEKEYENYGNEKG